MANEIKVNLSVNDNGTTEAVTARAKKLNSELEKAKKNASGIRPASQTAAISGANTDIEANRLAKGISGATGAAGRDFAKQAQGLGGLVHVYATFAANLFAVTAGFQALSKAADYSNMIKGLDQLGAASGKNLGTLSKDVAALTDGAVSLKESMAAVAQATSAGMSNKQIERMAVVAKQASQALGRDMADSLNRLSRGITKMEPELLDEIGIFVRVDKAASDYALSVGKSAAALTDFERRQAFATAALKQAEDKFGKIQLDANPYSKLQASVFDLLYSGGELLNKVLSPIASVLADSPTALGAGLIAIIALLTKQALPALADFRKSLKDSAEETKSMAEQYVKRAQEARTANLSRYKEAAEAEAEAQQSALEKTAAKQSVSTTTGKGKLAGWVKDMLDNPNVARDVTDDQLTKLDALAAKRNKITGELTKNAEAYGKLAIKLRAARDAEANYDLIVERIQQEKAKTAGPLSSEGMNQMIANRATRSSLSSTAVSRAAEATNVSGIAGGIVALKEGIKSAKDEANKAGTSFGIVSTSLTTVKGAAAIAATQIGRLVSAFGWIGMVVSAAVAVFQLLNSWMSKNGKEMEIFNSGVTKTGEALEGLTRTSEYLSKLDPLERLSASSLEARANALSGLAESVTTMVDGFNKANEKAGTWDSFTNWISKAWGGDTVSKITENLSTSIQETISKTTSKGASEKLTSELEKVLGKGKALDVKAIEKLAKAGDTAALTKLAKIIADNGKELSVTAAKAKEYSQAMDQAIKTNQSLMNSFIPSDAMSKFGIDQMNAAQALGKTISDTEASFSALYETIKDNQKLALIPEQALRPLLDNLPRIKVAQEEVGNLKNALATYQQFITDKEKELGRYGISKENIAKNEAIVGAKSAITETYAKIDEHQKNSTKYVTDMSAALYDSGAAKLTSALSIASQKAALEYKSIIASALGGVAGIKMESEIAREQLSIDRKQIEAAYSQVEALKKNTLAIEAQTVSDNLKDVQSKQQASGLTELQKKELSQQESSLLARQKDITTAQKFLAGGGNLQSRLAGKNTYDADTLAKLKADVGDIAQASLAKDVQLAALAGKSKGINLNEQLKLNAEKFKNEKEIYQTEQNRLLVEKDQLDTARSASTVYDEQLEAKIRTNAEALRGISTANEVLGNLETISKLSLLIDAQKKSELNTTESQAALDKERVKVTTTLATKGAKDSLEVTKAELAVIDRIYTSKQQDLEVTKKMLDLQSNSIDKLESANTITKSEAIEKRAVLSIQKESLATELTIGKLRDSASIPGTSPEAIAGYEAQISLKERDLLLTKGQIEIEAKYQKALIQTEETLKSLEKAGGSVSEYTNAMYQDFSNKVSDLVKNTKSAASAFNEGFIQAIDGSIDKFFEMMQTSTLNMKDMVKYVRNSLSDVFRDYASNLVKNTWKGLMSKILPPSDEMRAAKEQVSATNRLIEALDRNTSSKGGTPSGPAVGAYGGTMGPQISEEAYKGQDAVAAQLNAAEGFTEASGDQKTAAGGFISSAVDFGKGVYDWVTGAETTTGLMKKAVDTFGNMMPSFLTSTYSVISKAMAGLGAGASEGGSAMSGILGLVVKAGIGYMTGGWAGAAMGAAGSLNSLYTMDAGPTTSSAQITANAADVNSAGLGAFAKGGAFEGSSSLSAHSNSIVDSPTLFAFAKGGVPNRGVAGEAGPEAILPLKRDAQGNLGIRGGGGGDTNNIAININIQEGQASEDSSSGDQNAAKAKELGILIKAVVGQELIKQSRPGGLLAK